MRLLLHVCCGPCAIVPVERLRDAGYELVAYFANPNIHPLKEYLKRREAFAILAERLALPVLWQDDVYSAEGWLGHVYKQNFADNANGARCAWCTESRLALTFAAAKAHGFDAFSTSLLYSRYQNHDLIKAQGEKLSESSNLTPHFIYEDFRKGWEAGITAAKRHDLYRQNYCGCIFSETDRYAKTLRRCIETVDDTKTSHAYA